MVLLIEEFESIKLCDYSGLRQEEAAIRMDISRPTFTRIYENARKKVAEAFVEGKALIIEGGNFRSDEGWYRCRRCRHVIKSRETVTECDSCHSDQIKQLNIEDKMMKIALPTSGNFVDDHFGHCEMFTVFSIDENNDVVGSEIVPAAEGCGCKSGIATVLKEKGVKVMLAGNMGEGAVNVLGNNGIKVVRGCHGELRSVLTAWLGGEVTDSGHGCAGHHGEDGHGHQCHNH